jgi:phosphoglycerate dehydrogenase-like enzyme
MGNGRRKTLRIGVCSPNFTRLLQILQNALPADEIYACARDEVVACATDTDVFIPIVTPISAPVFSAPRLLLVQQFGVGLDSVDIPAASAAGVLVANVPSVGTGNAESVAELAIAHMLMLSRDMPLAFRRFRERRVSSPLGNCLWRSTVVILGYGGIGEEIARRLAGFGTRIIAVSRNGPGGTRRRDPQVHLDVHVAADQTRAAVAKADYVVVAAPATPENIGLVDADVFAHMKPGTFLVNIARGPVVDYDALRVALRDGRVAGAGLDVFWQEPFDPEDPLLKENVIATPHIGGATERSLTGIGEAVAANIERVRRGELPICCANPQIGRGRLRA